VKNGFVKGDVAAMVVGYLVRLLRLLVGEDWRDRYIKIIEQRGGKVLHYTKTRYGYIAVYRIGSHVVSEECFSKGIVVMCNTVVKEKIGDER